MSDSEPCVFGLFCHDFTQKKTETKKKNGRLQSTDKTKLKIGMKIHCNIEHRAAKVITIKSID